MKTILFKCSIGKVIGSGHVVRCLTLADALMQAFPQAHCQFWVPEEGLDFPALKSSPYETFVKENYTQPVDLLIVDNYDLDAEFETQCRTWAQKILVIDDLANRPHDCDILLDQIYGRSADDYKALAPNHAQILCGSEYALLRPDFANLREQSLQRRENLTQVQTILITLGSMNLHNISSLILQAFTHIDGAYKVTVVLSSSAQDLDKVRKAINGINNTTQHSCALALDVTHIAQLMADSDFAIGAGGTTSWERACLGLPCAVIELADNQSDIIKFLADKQALIPLGHYSNLPPAQAGKILKHALNCPVTLQALSQKSAAICDGLGAQRVVEQVKGLTYE